MKFDRSNKFDFCYYGQVNTFGSTIYFAGEGTNLKTWLNIILCFNPLLLEFCFSGHSLR